MDRSTVMPETVRSRRRSNSMEVVVSAPSVVTSDSRSGAQNHPLTISHPMYSSSRLPEPRSDVPTTRPAIKQRGAMKVAATPEWIQSILGRDWEIYWKKSACRLIVASPKPEDHADNDDSEPEDEEDDEETWYDATVLAMDDKSNKSSSSRSTKTYFQVKFLGEDDKLYSMALSPDLVRPSARAWIGRTQAILQATADSKQWEEALPPDTAILDRSDLKRIEQEIQRDYPVYHVARFHNASDESSNAAFLKLRAEHAACSQLMKVVRWQMFLRTQLATVESEDDEEEASSSDLEEEKDMVVTEAYVDYLLHCLSDLEHACHWHYQCWKLLHRLFAVDRNYQQSPAISKELLLRDFLALGRVTLTSLRMQDPSYSAFQKQGESRKRPLEATLTGGAADVIYAPLAKRPRTVPQAWLEVSPILEDGVSALNEENMSLLSFWPMIKAFVSQVCETDQRWYTKYMGNMLCSVSFMVMSPFMEWESHAQFFLGKLDIVKDEGLTATEEVSMEEASNKNSLCGPIKYEEIESLIESANHDRLLKCFTLSSYVSRLCDKLAAIDSFEARAWDLIATVLEEPDVSADKEDPTLCGLTALSDEARIKNGHIVNVRPIGRSTSRLFPEVVDNAILYRQWFLDLKHAESVRERVTFIQGLVARLSELPPLPARWGTDNSQYDTTSRIRLDAVMLRVRSLSDQCLEHVPKFNRYQAMLSERIPLNGFLSIQGALEALQELRCLPVISSVEEMLAIRCDILSWEAEAGRVLTSKQTNSFVDFQVLYNGIEEIRNGSSKWRLETVRGTKSTRLVDAEMNVFIQSELSSEFCSQLVSQTETLYLRSHSWKDRVDSVISQIQSFSNHVARGHFVASEKIELKDMEELRSEYFSLNVDISDTYDALLNILTPAAEWMTSMKNTLSNDSVPFEELLHFLMRNEPLRPVGINVEPVQHVVESLQELLRWYVSVRDYISKGNRDSELLRSLLFVGLQVLTRFCQKRNAGLQFTAATTAAEFLVASQIHREMCKSLEVAELYKNPLSCNVIERMTNEYQDDSRGAPMFFLLLSLWALYVDDFVARCFNLKLRSETSLVRAKELLATRPSTVSCSTGLIAAKDMMMSLRVSDLDQFVSEGETTEREGRSILESSACICQDCLLEAIEPTLVVLKEKLANFKGRWRNVGTVTLDPQLESQLEYYVKLFSWLARARRYPVLLDDAAGQSPVSGSTNVVTRIPWDTLVFLHDHLPIIDSLVGTFKEIALRVKEIHASAFQWQEDITNLTNLSLRGGTRRGRNPTFKINPAGADNADTLPCVDFDRLVSLSNSPILAKVYMPREDGIREVVQSTQKFESLFQDFFTVEYFGACHDLLVVPKEDSLVGEDGTFILRRFTRNPLFDTLRNSIVQISDVMTTMVVNNTKRIAFEWIRSAFSWIDILDTSVSADGPYFQHLSISSTSASEIIFGWGAIFRDIPEDLVTLLEDFSLFISISPDGSMNVDSRNGCCHYSLGALLLHWCPFIYDALKMDLNSVSEWECSVKKLLNEFAQFQQRNIGNLPSEPSVLQIYYRNRDEANHLLNSAADLFLTPDGALVDNCLSLLNLCSTYLKTYSNIEASKVYAETQYFSSEAVVKNRHLLLDALCDRAALALPSEDMAKEKESADAPIRQQCQMSFLKALLKTLKIVGIDCSHELRSMCTFKAWDIANCLYDLCNEKKSESERTSLFSTKGMMLKRLFLDLTSLALIFKVLNGVITPFQLVRMNAEELANAVVSKSREEASEAARQRLLLTGSQPTATKAISVKQPSVAKAVTSTRTPNFVDSKPIARVKREAIDTDFDTKLPFQKQTAVGSTNSAAASALIKSDPVPDRATKPSLGLQKSSSDEIGTPPGRSVKISDLLSKKRASGPPPPPPSLVQLSLASGGGSKPAAVPRATSAPMHSISNISGGYHFTLITNYKHEFDRQFQVYLVADVDSKRVAGNKRLSEIVKSRARVGSEDFYKFLADKLSRGHNEVLSFRVVPVSDSRDAPAMQQSNDFFDGSDALVMLASDAPSPVSGDIEKGYVVSPRFHRLCKRFVTFSDPNSTYLVMVIKRK